MNIKLTLSDIKILKEWAERSENDVWKRFTDKKYGNCKEERKVSLYSCTLMSFGRNDILPS